MEYDTEEIATGTISLNEFSGIVKVNATPRNITKYFIISFANATINIGNKIYRNTGGNPMKVIPPNEQPAILKLSSCKFYLWKACTICILIILNEHPKKEIIYHWR